VILNGLSEGLMTSDQLFGLQQRSGATSDNDSIESGQPFLSDLAPAFGRKAASPRAPALGSAIRLLSSSQRGSGRLACFAEKRRWYVWGMQRVFTVAAVLTTAAGIVPPAANARVVGIKLVQTRVYEVVRDPVGQTTPRRPPLPGDVLWSRNNLQWLGNRLGYAPQPWPVGVAVIACRITAYPGAQCAAR
jgi:hypothetical protein